jgi:nitroreductase
LNLTQAIEVRTSRRHFKDQEIDADVTNQINSLIAKYNQMENLNFKLIDNATLAFKSFLIQYGKFKGIKNAIALVARADEQDHLEKVGYYGEQLVLNMVTMGLDTCWVGVNFNRKSDVFALQENEELVAVLVFGYANDAPVNLEAEKYGIRHRTTLTIEEITVNDQILPHHVEEGIVAILKAPSNKNKQPVRVEYKNAQLKLTVNLRRKTNLIELGIAKAHYCIVNGGMFDWGNNKVHIK